LIPEHGHKILPQKMMAIIITVIGAPEILIKIQKKDTA
jgi:hypothetical protein